MAVQRSLVMTLIGPDQPGLVEELSVLVASHGGNWVESRMAHLAGHFAGILRVECAADQCEALIDSLRKVGCLAIQVEDELPAPPSGNLQRILRFDVMGNDRPGIVRELASTIAKAGGNVEELSSNLESAAHAGHPLFHATGVAAVSKDFDDHILVSALEALGPDLSVTVSGG